VQDRTPSITAGEGGYILPWGSGEGARGRGLFQASKGKEAGESCYGYLFLKRGKT